MSAPAIQPSQPETLPQMIHQADKRPKGIDHALSLKMRKSGMSYGEIAQAQGCSKTNVIQVLQRYGIAAQDIEEYKDNRADILAGLQHRIAISITNDDIQKAPLQVRMMALGIAYDKERLERGLSTTNVATQSQVLLQRVQDRINRIKSDTSDTVHNVLEKEQSVDITQDTQDSQEVQSLQNRVYLHLPENGTTETRESKPTKVKASKVKASKAKVGRKADRGGVGAGHGSGKSK